jgi:hypothetical protein
MSAADEAVLTERSFDFAVGAVEALLPSTARRRSLSGRSPPPSKPGRGRSRSNFERDTEPVRVSPRRAEGGAPCRDAGDRDRGGGGERGDQQ